MPLGKGVSSHGPEAEYRAFPEAGRFMIQRARDGAYNIALTDLAEGPRILSCVVSAAAL